MRRSAEWWARVGITVQFLALVRILAEYFRLKYVHGPRFTLALAEPFITGALIDAALCFLAVELYFFRRYAAVVIVAAGTVVMLLVYKYFAIGF